MDSTFVNQFSENIKFNYTGFNRVIIRGYIRNFFSIGCIVIFLKSLGFSKRTNGVMRIVTDQLNAHISKQAAKHDIPIFWWPTVDGGTDGAKLQYVQKHYANGFQGKRNFVFCILGDKEPVKTVIDKFSRVGWPDSIAQIFSKRPARSISKTFRRLYDNNACLKHWFRGNAIKQYNKTGYLIRTETTINNPKSLGLQKPVLYLQAYLWFGLGCNNRLLNCCADVDIASICKEEKSIILYSYAIGLEMAVDFNYLNHLF